MKTIAVILLSSQLAGACADGCFPYRDTCACDIKPEAAAPVQPSNEAVPQDKMPSYQREGIHADMPPSLIAQDEKADQERAEAIEKGKKEAGVQ
jgi:hypothetical protein